MTRPAPLLLALATLASCCLGAAPALAETLLASRTIRAGEVLAPGDVTRAAQPTPGGLSDPAQAIGMEARVALYAGRPLRAGDLGPPALVERNQIVILSYRQGGLQITTEGRALGRAGAGEPVRVMNLSSRNTVTAVVGPDGTVHAAGVGTQHQ